VAEAARLFPRQNDDPPRTLRESFEHLASSLPGLGVVLGAP
jgi:hypothetical protein